MCENERYEMCPCACMLPSTWPKVATDPLLLIAELIVGACSSDDPNVANAQVLVLVVDLRSDVIALAVPTGEHRRRLDLRARQVQQAFDASKVASKALLLI